MGAEQTPVFRSSARMWFVLRVTVEVREDGVYVRYSPYHLSFRHVPFGDIERVGFTDGPARELSRGLEDVEEGFERAKREDGFTSAGTPIAYTFSSGYRGAIRIDRREDRPITASTDEPGALAEAIAEAGDDIPLYEA